MRSLLMLILCALLAWPALADKPHYETPPLPARVPCGLTTVLFDWDFATGPHGFATGACDEQGAPVWEHGTTTLVPDAPGTLWGTVLEADYPVDAGESLISPTFQVDGSSYLVEVVHYYDMENLWDGGNLKVNGQIIAPQVGYPGMVNIPQDWYAWCVDEQMAFTGVDSGWLTSCFDLSSFIGQDVSLHFDFGSDDFGVGAGWYIAAVRVGSDEVVPVQLQTFGEVKALFR
jgi:hypothetical protein